jgi:hypothetical protein
MASSDLARASRELERTGLLLLHDGTLPSLTALVAGEPVRGSWWGHAKSRTIFRVASALAKHEDALRAKLVGGKVTFVHRRLWPSLLAVVTAGDAWQRDRLTAASARLLERVRAMGSVRCDDRATALAARALDEALLARAVEVHGERGAHALELEDWHRWARRALVRPRPRVELARSELEQAAADLGDSARLPWQGRRRA